MRYYKKTAAFLLGLTLCLGNMALPVTTGFADEEDTAVSETEENEFTEGIFTYTVDSDGNAVITGCSTTEKEVSVPDTLGGKPVTELSTTAFFESGAVKITIPAGITYISTDNPFASCLALLEIDVAEDNSEYCSVDGVLYTKDMKKLVHRPAAIESDTFEVPESVEELGIASLAESRLKSVTLPASIKIIGRHTFSYDAWLTDIDLSHTSVDTIDAMTFANCTALESVKMPDSVKNIEIAAFYGCKKLESIELPSELEYIGQSAFVGTGLKEIRIPESVTYIGYSAFGYDEEERADSDFTLIGAAGSVAYTYATDKDEEYNYSNNFKFKTYEEADAEAEYDALDKAVSGDYEYTAINGEACIVSCSAIGDTITVPNELDGLKVTSIRKDAFAANSAKELILPETVKTIGENAFSSELEKLTIPGGCEMIEGDETFRLCFALKEINVTEGDGAYSSENGVLYDHDKKLLIAYPIMKEDTTFKAPSTLEEIADYAFCVGTGKTGVSYGNGFLEEVYLSNVKHIGNYAFMNCEKLSKVVFSKDILSVGECAFLDCHELKSVRLGDKLEHIGDYAFGYKYDSDLKSQIEQGLVEANKPYSTVDGFKIFTSKDSLAYKYASVCNIETVTNTVEIGGNNVNKNFAYVIVGIIGAVVIAVIGIITGKSLSKKKAEKKRADVKAKAAASLKKAEEKADEMLTEEKADEESDD